MNNENANHNLGKYDSEFIGIYVMMWILKTNIIF